eukprot:3660211-Rhodomonas_salina.2
MPSAPCHPSPISSKPRVPCALSKARPEGQRLASRSTRPPNSAPETRQPRRWPSTHRAGPSADGRDGTWRLATTIGISPGPRSPVSVSKLTGPGRRKRLAASAPPTPRSTRASASGAGAEAT